MSLIRSLETQTPLNSLAYVTAPAHFAFAFVNLIHVPDPVSTHGCTRTCYNLDAGCLNPVKFILCCLEERYHLSAVISPATNSTRKKHSRLDFPPGSGHVP